jgi:hypothetical protein
MPEEEPRGLWHRRWRLAALIEGGKGAQGAAI